MSYLAEGDYFESCNCLITCRCTFGTTFDGDACDAFSVGISPAEIGMEPI